MKGYHFVQVYESGEEEPIDAGDLALAEQLAEDQGGVQTKNARTGERSTIHADRAMAVITQLGLMPRYRGCRIDAIEVGSPH